MLAHSILLILAAAFEITASQGFPGPPPLPPNLPQECLEPPNVKNPRDCCEIPAIFIDKDFESCGFKKRPDGAPDINRQGPPDCTRQTCLLKTQNLIRDDGAIDQTAIAGFMNKWAETNPDFKPTVESAKAKCLGRELPGPPEVCEADKIIFCISSSLFTECPKWKLEIDECRKLRNHIDTCEKFFV